MLVGVLLLAVLTSLPNAYTGVRLGRAGRGAALVSETMNSNTINLVGGVALPALFVGFGHRFSGVLAVDVVWLLATTALTRRAALAPAAACAAAAARSCSSPGSDSPSCRAFSAELPSQNLYGPLNPGQRGGGYSECMRRNVVLGAVPGRARAARGGVGRPRRAGRRLARREGRERAAQRERRRSWRSSITGAAIGHVDQGHIVIDDPTPNNGATPEVTPGTGAALAQGLDR